MKWFFIIVFINFIFILTDNCNNSEIKVHHCEKLNNYVKTIRILLEEIENDIIRDKCVVDYSEWVSPEKSVPFSDQEPK